MTEINQNVIMKYFYINKKEKIGPLSLHELKEASLERNTLVWREGLDNWKKAEEFEELDEIFNSIPPEVPTTTAEKVKDIASNELEANFKLLLIALGLTFFAYIIIGEINRPPYLSQQELTEMKEYLNQQRGSSFIAVGRWVGQSKYDDNIPLGALPNINEIRKDRFEEDVNSQTFIAFFIILGVLVIGRYISKASD